MDNARFVEVMQQERDRLHREREQIFNRQHELENKLAAINREFEAIEAYEIAKSGRTIATAGKRPGPRARQGRRGNRREALMQVIRANPAGVSRGEILQYMGLKGNKSGEMSVSNALTALIKASQLSRREGKYFASPGGEI